MAENLMNSDHKATNENYRDNYDATFASHPKELWPGLTEKCIKMIADDLKGGNFHIKGENHEVSTNRADSRKETAIR